MKVLLVDDHALFLEGLENLLTANDIEVVGTAQTGQAAWQKAKELQPEVILMDFQMPGSDGIEATRIIKAQFPNIKIVMLTVSQDDRHLFEAIKAGASGYLLKGLPRKSFLEQLAGLSHGESPLSPGLAAKILTEFSRLEQKQDAMKLSAVKIDLLSVRQTEILKFVASGLTYKEISNQMNLSESAIKYHMGEITSRLHLENRAQAIALASKMGLGSK